MNVVAPSAWAVIASLVPNSTASKMPTLDQMGFHDQAKTDTNQINQMTLPNGVGKFAVNITKSPQDSLFSKVLMTVFQAGTAMMPVLTLPAISVPAAKVFTEILGKWQGHASVVMNGNLTPVIATSKLPDGVLPPQDPMPLKTGYYIMVPTEHQPELAQSLDDLTVQNGFLVHKNAPASDDLLTRAAKAVPGVSYATMRVNVDKAPANGCSTKPTGAKG
jgi:hypothetical protein